MSNIEHCCLCDAATGRAGACEDSMYVGDKGPFCEVCYGTILLAIDEATSAHAAEVERLEAKAYEAKCLCYSYMAELEKMDAEVEDLVHRGTTLSNVLAAERDAAVARAETLENGILSAMDYWNRCEEPGAMSDALYEIENRLNASLAAAPYKPQYSALAPEPWGGPEGEE